MTNKELLFRLRSKISDDERRALADSSEDLYISDFNRKVIFQMLGCDVLESEETPGENVRELAEDLAKYLDEYMADHPEGHKWIIIACLYLTFIEKLPMHPRKAVKWQENDGEYICPSKEESSVTCRYCVCK